MIPAAREVEADALQHRIPLFAARVLHVDCGPGLLGRVARQRGATEVVGVFQGENAFERAEAAQAMARLHDTLQDAVAKEAPFDCIVLSGASTVADLSRCVDALAPEGYLVHVREGGSVDALVAPGLFPYAIWPYQYPQSELEEHFVPAADERHVAVFVRETYDPLAHAQQLVGLRHFDRAYEILCAVPPTLRDDANVDARLQIVKMVCLLGLQKLGAYPALTCLAGALFLFARVQRRLPNQPATLQLMARFWDAVGLDTHGARLRTLADELEGVSPGAAATPPIVAVPPPMIEINAGDRLNARVLFITGNERVNYGVDVLYHGLKRVLGEAGVEEFPFKSTLHGAPAAAFGYYPALFAHAGTPHSADDILKALQCGEFDTVLWGDADMELPRELARAIALAARPLHFALVDMRDDCADHSAELCAWLGLASPPPYFKRELLRGVQHACPVQPLTFAYPDDLVAEKIDTSRDAGVFWAGQRGWGLRDVFLPLLDARGIDTQTNYPQEAYRAQLLRSRACLNLAGAGFDTVRYWEVPAQGTLLLSEVLPLSIPADFVDMEEAIFFSTRKDLLDRLAYLDAHPAEVEAIRHAGWAKLRQHHTASARARQCLAGLQ